MSIVQNLLRLRKIPGFIRALLFKRVIFVFQMGKVGSQSAFIAIQRSLKGQSFQRRVMNQRGERNGKAGRMHSSSKYILIHGHMISFWDFYNFIIRWRARLGLPLKVICPIREPIARDVSAFFNFHVQYRPHLFAKTDLRELEKLFLADSWPADAITNHSFALNWFDEHFKPLTRIDVYKQPFPIDRKWHIYKRGFTRVLVYRNDLKRSEQTKLISRFLGIQMDEIRPRNTTKNKDYAEPYSRFRESVKLPRTVYQTNARLTLRATFLESGRAQSGGR